MADVLKILGQLAAAATTEASLYTVPASTTAIVSTMSVCNRSATAATFRIGFDQGGGGIATSDWVYYDLPIAGNDSFLVTAGFSLGAGDIIRVYASTANLSFQAFGVERT